MTYLGHLLKLIWNEFLCFKEMSNSTMHCSSLYLFNSTHDCENKIALQVYRWNTYQMQLKTNPAAETSEQATRQFKYKQAHKIR